MLTKCGKNSKESLLNSDSARPGVKVTPFNRDSPKQNRSSKAIPLGVTQFKGNAFDTTKEDGE